jgi:membrane-associated phospholipid phosphatase
MAVASMNGLIKWIIGRTRPFKLYDDRGESMIAPFHFDPFRGGWRGLFFGENLCFPSGHVAMAFAAATALAILWPRARWRWVPFVWAAIVGLERVAANAHWPSDCVAAAALGVGGVQLVHWMAKKISRTADTDVADERLVATRPTGS